LLEHNFDVSQLIYEDFTLAAVLINTDNSSGDELDITGFISFLMRYSVFNFEHKRIIKQSISSVSMFE
jgi:hypothetical protein